MNKNKINEIADQAVLEYLNTIPHRTVPRRDYLFESIFAKLIMQDILSNVEEWEKDSRNHISYLLRNHYEN